MSEEGESQSTTTTKPKPPYRGITWHAGKWLVKLRHNRRDVTIGHCTRAEDAAWVADYARYILRGLNPACRGPKTMKPNFPPRESEYVNGWGINWRLIGAGAISLELARDRAREYYAAARANCEGSAG
ncbi:MAG: hypothetical protein ABSG86_22490 [Thermoguttaceae bacterium]|jgi:hypothetical protein